MNSQEEITGCRILKPQVYIEDKDRTFCQDDYIMNESEYAKDYAHYHQDKQSKKQIEQTISCIQPPPYFKKTENVKTISLEEGKELFGEKYGGRKEL